MLTNVTEKTGSSCLNRAFLPDVLRIILCLGVIYRFVEGNGFFWDAVLMVGVDLPCSLVGTAGRFIGETLTWPLVVTTQQYMVPIERNTNE